MNFVGLNTRTTALTLFLIQFLALSSIPCVLAQTQTEVEFEIRADQKPVKSAEIILVRGGTLLGDFDKLPENGRVKLEVNSPEEKIEYLVRSPGFAIATAEIPKDASLGKRIEVNLTRGVAVELNLESSSEIPADLIPAVFPDQFSQGVVFSMDAQTSHALLRMSEVIPLKANPRVFQFRTDPKNPIRVMVHQPGFLRGYVSEPLFPEEKIVIRLPEPVRVKATFIPTDLVEGEEASLVLFRTYKSADAMVRMVYEHREGRVSGVWNDISPGEYQVEGSAFNAKTFARRNEDVRKLSFASKSDHTLNLVSAPEQNRFKGDAKATVHLINSEGKPAKDTRYEVTFFDTNTFRSISLANGRTDQSGSISLADFKCGKDAIQLNLRVRGLDLPLKLDREEKEQNIDVVIPPAGGDRAPDVEVMSLASGKPVAISSFRGQYLIVDFWAKWCGACQQPLSDLNNLYSRKRSAWSNKVAILPISLDETKEEPLEHIKTKGWQSLPHAWDVPGSKNGFSGPAATAYRVWGVPDSLIIDPTGVILWRGFPWGYNYEHVLDSLLTGQLTAEEIIKLSQKRND